MDYDVINQVIAEIISFLKKNEKMFRYDVKLLENLTVSLLGYYLVLGPNIFKTITKILRDLDIYRCEDDQDYLLRMKLLDRDYTEINPYLLPVTLWNAQFDEEDRFLGYVPHVVYKKEDDLNEVLTLTHELSHIIDGANAILIRNKDDSCDVKLSFSHLHIDTNNPENNKDCKHGFGEFAAVSIENKVLQELKTLDPTKINYDFIKVILSELSLSKVNISSAYTTNYVVFKDLVDNPKFFALMKKYYYEESNEEEFKKAYETYGSDLSFDKLKRYIMVMFEIDDGDKSLSLYDVISKEVEKFNDKTNYVVKKQFLLMS